jgi:hypothetical protein
MPDHPTVRTLMAGVADAYAGLTEIAETIEDEWGYINDLTAAWTARLDAIALASDDEVLAPAVQAAVDAAVEEIGRIRDPHRAIDWLSTFPQVVCLALGERP